MKNQNKKFDEKKFKDIKERAEELYKTIGKIKCPYLDDFVHFNTKGLDHLIFGTKKKSRTRPEQEQMIRFRILNLAPEIIARSHTLQEFNEMNSFERVKINSRWEKRMKKVKYYAFIAIVGELRAKVIVKEVEGGVKFFYSIHPFWKKDHRNGKKLMYSGDLEED